MWLACGSREVSKWLGTPTPRGTCIAAVRGRRGRRGDWRGDRGWHPHAWVLDGTLELTVPVCLRVLDRVDGNLSLVRDRDTSGDAEELELEDLLQLGEFLEEPWGSLNLAAVPDVC